MPNQQETETMSEQLPKPTPNQAPLPVQSGGTSGQVDEGLKTLYG